MAFVAPSGHVQRSKLGRIAPATVVLLVVFAVIAFVVQRLGIGPGWIVGAALAIALCLSVGIGLAAATARPLGFYLADRILSAVTTGLGSAAASFAVFGICSAGWLLGLGLDGPALALGVVGGFVLSATLFAPFLRRSGAYTVAEFLAGRFGAQTRLVTVPVVFAVCFLLLLAQLQLAGLSAALFGAPASVGVWTVAAIATACALFGGMRAVTATMLAQMVVLLVGLLVPLLAIYLDRFGTLSPAAMSEALARYSEQGQAAAPGAPELSFDSFLAGALCSALAVASLPPVGAFLLAGRSGATARRSAVIGLAVMLLLMLAAAGWAGFVKLAVFEQFTGIALSEAGKWASAALLDLGRAGMVSICGVAAGSAEAVAEACAALPGHGELLQPGDVQFRADAALAAAPGLLGLSAVGTALMVAALLAGMLAASGVLLVTAANTLSYDLFTRTLLPRGTRSARLALARLAVLATGTGAAWAVQRPWLETVPLLVIALNLAAGVLFPALAVGIWWKRAKGWAALCGMVAGLAVTCGLLFGLRQDMPAESVLFLGPVFAPVGQVVFSPGLAGNLAGLLGALANAVVIVGLSWYGRPARAERQAFTEALWRAQARPLMHPEETRPHHHATPRLMLEPP